MFQLIQRNKVLAEAVKADELAFCRLDCHTDWEVWFSFPLPMSSQTLVTVRWPPAEGYTMVRWLEGGGDAVLNKQLSHSTIIPAVKRLLTEATANGRFDTYYNARRWYSRVIPTGDSLW